MTIGGWIFMILSVSFVVGLAAFCFYRVLTASTHSTQTEARPASFVQQANRQQQRKKTSG